MEISGLCSALVIGLIIGGLGRLVLPGKQKIGILWTLVVGAVAALLGTLVASVIGVTHTGGVDWIELALQVGFAVVGVSLVAGRR
ncbi:MAG: GlsB/YeaQ/YmgE family stress response membrane protein [Micromonosporaceae bacterium]|nr:GlsB/YeaQ/YmgE family stress response membrane protein [Micromonosporaceae bacterium]